MAVTFAGVVELLMDTEQVPVPEHPPPDHPENPQTPAGAAESITGVPQANAALHVAPQLMPAGLLVTDPDPTQDTLRVPDPGACNVAVMVAAELEMEVMETPLAVPE